MCKELFHTSQRTKSETIIKTSRLMLFRKIINIGFLSRQTQHLNTICSVIYFSTTTFGRFIRPSSGRNTGTYSEKYVVEEVYIVAADFWETTYQTTRYHILEGTSVRTCRCHMLSTVFWSSLPPVQWIRDFCVSYYRRPEREAFVRMRIYKLLYVHIHTIIMNFYLLGSEIDFES
jgi:hypothetical protein